MTALVQINNKTGGRLPATPRNSRCQPPGFPQGPTKSKSVAAFGQLTYDITPDSHLTGGIRYTKDNKSRVGATVLDFNTVWQAADYPIGQQLDPRHQINFRRASGCDCA